MASTRDPHLVYSTVLWVTDLEDIWNIPQQYGALYLKYHPALRNFRTYILGFLHLSIWKTSVFSFVQLALLFIRTLHLFPGFVTTSQISKETKRISSQWSQSPNSVKILLSTALSAQKLYIGIFYLRCLLRRVVS